MATKAYSPPSLDDLGQQNSPPPRRRHHRRRDKHQLTRLLSSVLAYIVVIGLTLAFLYFVLENT
jgi:hypothetical protein